jgi:hypothetical protein
MRYEAHRPSLSSRIHFSCHFDRVGGDHAGAPHTTGNASAATKKSAIKNTAIGNAVTSLIQVWKR